MRSLFHCFSRPPDNDISTEAFEADVKCHSRWSQSGDGNQWMWLVATSVAETSIMKTRACPPGAPVFRQGKR